LEEQVLCDQVAVDDRHRLARPAGAAEPAVDTFEVTDDCACETRNPSGAFCLGEVTKTVTRLMRGGLLSDPAHRRLTKELRLARNRLISACAWS